MTAAPASRPPPRDPPTALARFVGPLRRGWEDDQRLRFLVVGAYNTAFGFAAFPALYLVVGRRAPYLALLVAAHVLAVTNAFIAHRTLAFRASGPWLRQYLRFSLGQLGVLAFGLVTLPLLVGRVGLSPLVAQPMLAVVAVAFSYVWHHRVSFRSAP